MTSPEQPGAVPRIGRQLDVVGTLLFIAGAVCAGWAYVGFERLRASGGREFRQGMQPFEMLGEHAHWVRVTWIGAGLMVAGLGVAVAAAIVARRRR